jgi:polyisoprenoid-binding protein YceI
MLSINFSYSQEKLNINIEKSTIKWIGEYTFYFGGHDGFINFKEGYFIKKNNVITGGEFIIDMNSITNTDIEEQKGKDSLIEHLKDPDFFDVKKYPLGTLKITKVEYRDKISARIEADLMLKGITKSINFQAEFNYTEKEMKTRFKIDRKRWNVNYESKFKDGAISDAIGFEVSIKL